MAYCQRCRAEIDGRNAEIEQDFRSGMTMDAIGLKFEITRERVRQILKLQGVPPRAGGQTVRTIEHAKTRELRRRSKFDKRAGRVYGCDYNLARELNKGLVFSAQGSRARSYIEQRRNAKTRGIRWEINFPDWCRIWDESGKWDERGRSGYCMARIGDSGPYKIGNVEIITTGQNASDSYLITPGAERYRKSERCNTDPNGLTARERQALDLHLQGQTVTAIAAALGVKRATAWQYVNFAQRKLAPQVDQVAA